MTEWHGDVVVPLKECTTEQLETLTHALPGFGTIRHDTHNGQATLMMQVEASTLKQASEAVLRTAREATAATFGTAIASRQLRVLTSDDHLAELEHPHKQELMGYAEVAEFLDVSRQRVNELATIHAEFPAPISRLKTGPIFTRESIQRFAGRWERHRTGRPHTTT